jgi:REP element-mobilizing transposase RayT
VGNIINLFLTGFPPRGLASPMPRGHRLDAPPRNRRTSPGVLHHVKVRGIERRDIVRDRRDRTDFVARVARQAAAAWTVYAWALLPTHGHLLVRTPARARSPALPPWLATAMRALHRSLAGLIGEAHDGRVATAIEAVL